MDPGESVYLASQRTSRFLLDIGKHSCVVYKRKSMSGSVEK